MVTSMSRRELLRTIPNFHHPEAARPGPAGNAESCTVTNPGAGTWYIFVAVWDPYAGATLKATVTP